jgi:predicted membrane channel-forming protein YqfA (hemolysin III family)
MRLVFIISALLLCSCSAHYHVVKAMNKGYRCDENSDTIRITTIDSIPYSRNDTIFWEKVLVQKDTVIKYNTSFVPKTRWQTRIEYKITRDTIRQTQRIEVAKYKSEKKKRPNIWLFIIGFFLGIITKYLFQYAKKAL